MQLFHKINTSIKKIMLALKRIFWLNKLLAREPQVHLYVQSLFLYKKEMKHVWNTWQQKDFQWELYMPPQQTCITVLLSKLFTCSKQIKIMYNFQFNYCGYFVEHIVARVLLSLQWIICDSDCGLSYFMLYLSTG